MGRRYSKMQFDKRKPSTPSSDTLQWVLNGYYQPPSTPEWGSNSHNQPPSKVVLTLPHSVESERNITDSATKIQRVTRGFLVRKTIKKMLKMKVELEEIKKKVNDEETVKMIKEVQMERRRIDESLTSLLRRLDSVRVFDCSPLREFRKSLINKAIFLDEFVDQIQMVVKCEDEDEEILRRMMDENREMVRRMMDEKEKQSSVLTSLTQRVEQLEEAFTSDAFDMSFAIFFFLIFFL
ncbi:unnamed protein product [Lathyrus sativus]|nr:unnamed protein product [Lathyrus sativus]